MTTVYLAYTAKAIDRETLQRHAGDEPVDLLVALQSFEDFDKHRSKFNIRQWCLDSGAFIALSSGQPISYSQWADAARGCDAGEIFGLDVIGDEIATRANLERAWADGIAAIPTFHRGEPWESLAWCCQSWPKIALGGVAKVHAKAKQHWIGQCFARCWPHRIHGFGCSSKELISSFPFHSVDASSWSFAPCAMGMWCGFTGTQTAIRTRSARDLWIEVVEHQRRAREARLKWKPQLERLRD